MVCLLRWGRQVDQDLPRQRRVAGTTVRSLLRDLGTLVRDRAWGLGGRGEVPPVLALRQPQGLSGREPRWTQRRLLGNLRDVRRAKAVTQPENL